MSQRNENLERLALYEELNDVVSAMKNLAQVELHRVKRAMVNQQPALLTVEEAVASLQASGGASSEAVQAASGDTLASFCVTLVLGSERGFCGGFNEQIVRSFESYLPEHGSRIIIGSRLASKIMESSDWPFFSAPSTTDEVLPCVQAVTDYILANPLPESLQLLHHTSQGITMTALRPLPKMLRRTGPPLSIQLPMAELCRELEWQYLNQTLLQAFFTSLWMENRLRLQQMEGAREHIEDLTRELRLRINTLRQQEIVEEIEVMLTKAAY
ncbi:MAG: F0F1 ATP synthase subunit gamma [Hahellaceae bacterium]|nr:F0F1 ATP synthase subunit gamma [Hahellaceae bacterium]